MEDILDDFQVEENEEFEGVHFHKPSLNLRIKATFIDTMTVIGLMYLASLILEALNIQDGTSKAVILGLILMYEPILVSFGGTIGHRIMGLRISNKKDLLEMKQNKNINIFQSVVRYIAKILLGWISLLTIHMDNYGGAIHDKISSSIVDFA